MKRLATGLVLGAVVLTACGGSDEPEKPKTFDVSGSITLRGDAEVVSGGGACQGAGPYDDIRPGATVVVYDATNKKVGLGKLADGTTSTGQDCNFDFTVLGVEDTGNIYTVEVSKRGEITFKKADATKLALTLG